MSLVELQTSFYTLAYITQPHAFYLLHHRTLTNTGLVFNRHVLKVMFPCPATKVEYITHCMFTGKPHSSVAYWGHGGINIIVVS